MVKFIVLALPITSIDSLQIRRPIIEIFDRYDGQTISSMQTVEMSMHNHNRESDSAKFRALLQRSIEEKNSRSDFVRLPYIDEALSHEFEILYFWPRIRSLSLSKNQWHISIMFNYAKKYEDKAAPHPFGFYLVRNEVPAGTHYTLHITNRKTYIKNKVVMNSE